MSKSVSNNEGACMLSHFSSVQFSSVAHSCPTLCNPMNCSTPDLPVHHQLQEFTQTHVHRVSDAIQPSHPLSSPSPPAPNPSMRHAFNSWVKTIPWRAWQPTPVYLPGESHWQRSLWATVHGGRTESDMTEWQHTHACTHMSPLGEGTAVLSY